MVSVVTLVRVVGLTEPEDSGETRADLRALGRSLGSGVVILDNGTILTNLHVVQGARKIRVRFANGHESDAQLISVQPENDLAVLKASSLPDDAHGSIKSSSMFNNSRIIERRIESGLLVSSNRSLD